MEILLSRNDVEVNAVNDNGDTALHKASFIGREVKTGIVSVIFFRFRFFYFIIYFFGS